MSDLRFRNCQQPSSSSSLCKSAKNIPSGSCIQNRRRESISALVPVVVGAAVVGVSESEDEEDSGAVAAASGAVAGEEPGLSGVLGAASVAAATANASGSPDVNRLIYIFFEKYK